MSEDFQQILASIYQVQKKMLARVDDLEKKVASLGAVALPAPGSWGFCSPTSPPSKRIQLRRCFAWMYDPARLETGWSVGWPDLLPELSVSAFANAYYYRAVLPFMSVDFQFYDAFEIWEGDTEYATFEECAASFMTDFFNWDVQPETLGQPFFPLCALAVRNDGTTGAINRYHDVTMGDRSRSSFIMRDLRPWFTTVSMWGP